MQRLPADGGVDDIIMGDRNLCLGDASAYQQQQGGREMQSHGGSLGMVGQSGGAIRDGLRSMSSWSTPPRTRNPNAGATWSEITGYIEDACIFHLRLNAFSVNCRVQLRK